MIEVDPEVYPVEAVMGAAYAFIDRHYVFLTRTDGGRIRVEIRPKEAAGSGRARDVAGAFGNELLNQALRLHVARATRAEREMIVARALASQARPDPGGAADYRDDPLGIARPWEDRFGEDAAAADGAPRTTKPRRRTPGGGKTGTGKRKGRR